MCNASGLPCRDDDAVRTNCITSKGNWSHLPVHRSLKTVLSPKARTESKEKLLTPESLVIRRVFLLAQLVSMAVAVHIENCED
jgi:hypothetical protein